MSADIIASVGAETAGLQGFEGPEKILEVDFVRGMGSGLRKLQREKWDAILDLARCKILCGASTDHFDAYVLSESSLFVFDFKVYIKTCGTTTLLRCLPLLLDEARQTLGMELEWLGYSRKNFTFPSDQQFPHTSFTDEVFYTKKCNGPKGEQLVGGAHVLGDLSADHWYVYVADYCQRDLFDSTDITVNIMMHDLDPNVAKIFFFDESEEAKKEALASGLSPNKYQAKRATTTSGIDTLVPGARIDDWMFEPCGYSMNALLFDTWYTIHITPEQKFSYASFETNLHASSYEALVRNVLTVFRPGRFTVTMFADRGSFSHMKSVPNDISRIASGSQFRPNNRLVYRRCTRSSTCLATDYICDMASYVLDDGQVNRNNASAVTTQTLHNESPFSFLLNDEEDNDSPSVSVSSSDLSNVADDFANDSASLANASSNGETNSTHSSNLRRNYLPPPIPISKLLSVQASNSNLLLQPRLRGYDATEECARSV